MAKDISTYRTYTLCYNTRRDPPPVQCTFGQVRKMCELLEEALLGCSFRPEPIHEGGIQFTDWPEKQNDYGYKTFRFTSASNYPWVDAHTPNEANFYLSRREDVDICLKAFESAPPFTDEELVAFRQVFENVVQPADGWRFKRTPLARTLNKKRGRGDRHIF